MKVVTRRTGLSPHLIRIWERRHHAVSPCRSRTNRRLYSDGDVTRLMLLHQATRAGHSIGQIARLTEEELRQLVEQDGGLPRREAEPAPAAAGQESGRDHQGEVLAAIRSLDGAQLERALNRATAELGQVAVLTQVVVPLVHRIGELWQEGVLKVAHEHVATAALRTFLGNLGRPRPLPGCAPRLLVTTPPGQVHELGAMLAVVAAGNVGWRVTYLGPSLPAEEVAGAALQHAARAVAVSIVYPEDDPDLGAELMRLRQLLPAEVVLLAGGRAAGAYAHVLGQIGAIRLENLADFQAQLAAIRHAGGGRVF
ncbi:MAG: MerR family transcriptional regulator [Verrucomicrobia bacterium]|nr:MerR family transcriptional regulator [Verrucomicrobiota bacterium]